MTLYFATLAEACSPWATFEHIPVQPIAYVVRCSECGQPACGLRSCQRSIMRRIMAPVMEKANR